MKASELIDELQRAIQEHGDIEIMILDGFNGGGSPREINLGPVDQEITQQDIDDTADCEEMEVGSKVLVMGYGFY